MKMRWLVGGLVLCSLFLTMTAYSQTERTRINLCCSAKNDLYVLIKSPWIIPSPKKDRSQLLCYTPTEEKMRYGSATPVFSAGAKIKEIVKTTEGNGKYELRFTQATDKDIVYSYEISSVDKATGSIIKTVSTLSDFYLHANHGEMAISLTKTIDLADSVLAPFSPNYGRDYYIRVLASDCFGLKSNPLSSEVIYGSNQRNDEGNLQQGSSLLKTSSGYLRAGIQDEHTMVSFVPQPTPHFDGSFLQANLCGSWTDARWQEEFAAMKDAGMHYLVIGPVAQSYQGRSAETLYPSSLPNTEMARGGNGMPYPDIVDACLRNAESAGMKVFIGIGMNDKWWSLSMADSTWLYNQMDFDNEVCDEVWHLYKKKYPDAFYGWYWAYEVANVNLTPRAEEVLAKAMNIQLDHLTSANERLPFMWCPFMNSQFGPPQAYEAMWKRVFAQMHTDVGDIFCPQDCVGAGGLKLDQVADWFSALRQAVDTKPGLVMWSDVETFDHYDWSLQQLAVWFHS